MGLGLVLYCNYTCPYLRWLDVLLLPGHNVLGQFSKSSGILFYCYKTCFHRICDAFLCVYKIGTLSIFCFFFLLHFTISSFLSPSSIDSPSFFFYYIACILKARVLFLVCDNTHIIHLDFSPKCVVFCLNYCARLLTLLLLHSFAQAPHILGHFVTFSPRIPFLCPLFLLICWTLFVGWQSLWSLKLNCDQPATVAFPQPLT